MTTTTRLTLLAVVFVVIAFIVVLEHIVKAEPLVNSSNGSIEVNITNSNIIESANNTAQAAIGKAHEIKENMPNSVTVKTPGFDIASVLLAVGIIGWVLRRKVI